MKDIALVLPLPPSVNAQYRNYTTDAGRRCRVPTPDAVRWSDQAAWLARNWRQQTGWQLARGTKIIADYWVWWPDGRRRDTHNLEKLLWDTLEGILYDDDRWVLSRCQDFGRDARNPRVELRIRRFDGEEHP